MTKQIFSSLMEHTVLLVLFSFFIVGQALAGGTKEAGLMKIYHSLGGKATNVPKDVIRYSPFSDSLFLIKALPQIDKNSNLMLSRDSRINELLRQKLSEHFTICFWAKYQQMIKAAVLPPWSSDAVRLNQLNGIASTDKPVIIVTPLMTFDELIHELVHVRQYSGPSVDTESADFFRAFDELKILTDKFPNDNTLKQAADILFKVLGELSAYNVQLNYLKDEPDTDIEFEVTHLEPGLGFKLNELQPQIYREKKRDEVKMADSAIMPVLVFNQMIKDLKLSNLEASKGLCNLLNKHLKTSPPFDYSTQFPACK